MEPTKLSILVVIALGMPGCGSNGAQESAAPPTPPEVSADFDAPAPVLPSPEARRSFEEDLAAQIERLERQIGSVRELAEEESGELGDELGERTRRLEETHAKLEAKLGSMRRAGEHEWLELRREVDGLVQEIQAESGRMVDAVGGSDG